MTALSLTLLVPSSQHHCITILAYAGHLSVDHLLFLDYFSIFTMTTVLVRFFVLHTVRSPVKRRTVYYFSRTVRSEGLDLEL